MADVKKRDELVAWGKSVIERAKKWHGEAVKCGYSAFWDGVEETGFNKEGQKILRELVEFMKAVEEYTLKYGERKAVYVHDAWEYMKKNKVVVVEQGCWVQAGPNEPQDYVSGPVYVLDDGELAELYIEAEEAHIENGYLFDVYRYIE